MGFQFEIEEPDRDIGYVSFDLPWTWDEFDAQVEAMWTAVRALPHPVSALLDMTRIGHLPGGNVLAHLQHMDTGMPDNVELVVLVNAPYAFVNFMSIIMRIRPRVKEITRYTHSLEEAKMVIQQRRKQNHLANP
jgi:hypothetical protein